MWEQAGVGAWIVTVLEHWVGKAWEERKKHHTTGTYIQTNRVKGHSISIISWPTA